MNLGLRQLKSPLFAWPIHCNKTYNSVELESWQLTYTLETRATKIDWLFIEIAFLKLWNQNMETIKGRFSNSAGLLADTLKTLSKNISGLNEEISTSWFHFNLGLAISTRGGFGGGGGLLPDRAHLIKSCSAGNVTPSTTCGLASSGSMVNPPLVWITARVLVLTLNSYHIHASPVCDPWQSLATFCLCIGLFLVEVWFRIPGL